MQKKQEGKTNFLKDKKTLYLDHKMKPMTNSPSRIVVPIDFTDVTTNALNYASSLAHVYSSDVALIHIVKSESEEATANQKLKLLAESAADKIGREVHYQVFEGDVLEDMGKLAASMNASLIVLGTHGETGLQKMFGSRALKLINHSKVPFIVVQKHTEYKNIKKIAMTIDLATESVQVVRAAASLGNKFNAEIILIGGNHSDEDLKRKVKINMRTCLTHLQEAGVSSSIELLDRKDFEKNLIDFCQQNNIDMLAATYYADTFHAFSTKFVQHLLENDLQIPVITIDSQATGVFSNLSFLTV